MAAFFVARTFSSVSVTGGMEVIRHGGQAGSFAAGGAALMIFLHQVAPGHAVYLVGLIPLFVGAALLIFSELFIKPSG